MTTEQRIEIPLSKQKLILTLIGSLVFVAIGLWFVINPSALKSAQRFNPTAIMLVGYAAIVFFGLCVAVIVSKLPDQKPGLIIDAKGLHDNSSGVSAGEILWEDIEALSVIQIHRQKLILLQVKNPQAYIDRQTSGFKRKMMSMNHRMYGTPVSITTNGLKISFDELYAILISKLETSRKNNTL